MNEINSPIETYRQEAEELLADIEETVLDLEQTPDNKEYIDRLFRSMHTIKGSGAMFGFDDIAGFTHHVETLLDYVRNGEVEVNNKLIDLILASRDHIKAMLNSPDDPENADRSTRLIHALHMLMPGTDKENFLNTLELEPVSQDIYKKNEKTAYSISFHPGFDIMKKGIKPILLINEIQAMGDCLVKAKTDLIPSLAFMDPEKCYLVWDIILITEKDINTIEDVFIFVQEDSQINIEKFEDDDATINSLVPRLGDILIKRGDAAPEDVNEILRPYQEQIGDSFIKSGIVSQNKIKSALIEQKIITKEVKKSGSGSLRVASDKLDSLVNLVGELVITQARISQLTDIANEFEETKLINPEQALEKLLAGLGNPIETLERLTNELRECALNMRMVPIGTTFGRFRRLVRDLSTELGKEIELITQGAETELDKTIIERLSDPLVHLIRNSIDHGIRDPDTREQYGKERKGTIRLSAFHKGSNVVIILEDDGMGMNPEIIRQRAVEKGLIKPDAQLTEDEIFSLIFISGFSTAKEVSNVSGRGVGLDVVKREIDSLGGTIRITSKRKKHTRIIMSLPLTLAIIDGLLIKSGEHFFVLPLSQVEECTELDKFVFEKHNKRNMVMVRDELIPFIRLRDIFYIHGKKSSLEHLAIVQADNSRIGIVVDRIIGNIQAVIKSLGRHYKNAEGISGATIMGDGSVALVIDISGLIRCARQEEKKITG